VVRVETGCLPDLGHFVEVRLSAVNGLTYEGRNSTLNLPQKETVSGNFGRWRFVRSNDHILAGKSRFPLH
jgi:hypothetical protein